MTTFHPQAWTVCIVCGLAVPPEILALVPAEELRHTHRLCPKCSEEAVRKNAVIVVECTFPTDVYMSKGTATGRALPVPRVWIEGRLRDMMSGEPVTLGKTAVVSMEHFAAILDEAERDLVKHPMAAALWGASPSHN